LLRIIFLGAQTKIRTRVFSCAMEHVVTQPPDNGR